MKVGLGLVLVLAGTSAAFAQRSPDLATLDRGDGITRLGLDAGLTLLDNDTLDAALRLEPYGQYVTPNGLGLYGAIPFAHSFGDGSTNAVGDADLGILYVYEPSRVAAWVFRGGFALPLASHDPDRALTNGLAAYPRLTDLALALRDAYYLRLAISSLVQRGTLYARADLGVDVGINGGGMEKAHTLVRFNAGAGLDLGVVALGLELANLAAFDKLDGERFVHALSLSLRFMGEQLQPVIAVGAPLDAAARDDVTLYVSAGVQWAFR